MTASGPRAPLVEGQFGLLDLLPEEICTCLTVSDFHQFRYASVCCCVFGYIDATLTLPPPSSLCSCIRLNEFLLRAWEKDKKTKIADITQRFERVAYWVATEICAVSDLYKRKATLEHFIAVADVCFSSV